MQNSLTILPSSRSIRHKILSQKNENTLLQQSISISEFLNRILSVKDAINIDSDIRDILLLEASEFKNFDTLKIERNFFTFVQNSSYIFRFLQELSTEEVEIEDIESADTYGDYEEHLAVLHELSKRYESICKREGVIDSIFLKKEYTLNVDYLKRFSTIHLLLEGYLSNFELNILKQCAKVVNFHIEFEVSRYNKKTVDKFRDLGFVLEQDYNYILNLTDKKIVSSEKIDRKYTLTCKQFSQRIEQIAFIKEQVYLMIRDGIEPENIAVITPDESFASQIRLFDSESNFNFAMGCSFEESEFYKKLNAATKLLDNKTIQNSFRTKRMADETYENLRLIYHDSYSKDSFEIFMEFMLKHEPSKRIREVVEKELFNFYRLQTHLKALSMKQVLHIFSQRIKKLTIDDVGGGKITVMGLLESRGVSFDGVVIVDFNEDYVPRSSEKDLFLNSTIRLHSGLPTQKDREALQKHYYHLLISRAKKVCISYVENEDSVPSRFLTQLGIESVEDTDAQDYTKILFKKGELHKHKVQEIISPFDFTNFKLSSTGLKSFLTCKRQFYYRYIAKIKSHEIPKELPQEYEIGNIIHNVLKNVYEKQGSFKSKNELKDAIESGFKELNETNPLINYQIKLWKKILENFYTKEIERFSNGYSVISCENELTCKYEDVTVYGKIDRIDIYKESLEVIDYKSGNYNLYNKKNLQDATDFQLEFYYILASTLGRVNGCGFYDLKEAKIVPEVFLDEKLKLLKSHLVSLRETKEFNFELCEDIKNCRYCEYSLLCNRA